MHATTLTPDIADAHPGVGRRVLLVAHDHAERPAVVAVAEHRVVRWGASMAPGQATWYGRKRGLPPGSSPLLNLPPLRPARRRCAAPGRSSMRRCASPS